MALPSDFPPLGLLADELLPGGLETFVRDLRDQGISWDRIARRMADATDKRLDPNGNTVKGWWDRMVEGAAA